MEILHYQGVPGPQKSRQSASAHQGRYPAVSEERVRFASSAAGVLDYVG